MAALLAQQLDGRHLVIAPPHLLDRDKRGSWPNVFSDFQVRQTDFESIGKLDDLLQRDITKYTNVFIDESHRFRTETTQSYETLAQICRGKRVILVSATPLNNTPRDILSQVKLFQAGKASNIPNLRNLEAFFLSLEARLKGLDRQADRDNYFRTVQGNAKETREKVLKFLMVRRTRTEIERYYGQDMKKQGLMFPDVEDPTPLFYRLSKQENEIFNETLRLLTSEFTYARYTPFLYYEGKMDERERQGQRNLAKFMKILMVKRLESSFHAFRLTLDRFTHSYARVITEFKKGNVYISKKHISKIFDLFAKLNSKKTITGEDEEEESELEYLTEIRNVRDKQPDLFARIKRLPKKARSSRMLQSDTDIPVCAMGTTGRNACATLPALLTYFRQGRLDKFYLATDGPSTPVELDFLTTVKVLKPTDPDEERKPIPPDFYALLDRNKAAFAAATSPENDDAIPHHKGAANDAYILKRLRAKEVRRYHGFTDEDEDFIREVIQLLLDGALPKPTTKKVAAALKKEIDPLKVLGILKRDISPLFFKATRAQQMHHASMPREVILSSWIISGDHTPEKEASE